MSYAYYNEIDTYAAHWLRNLITAGHIAPGVVDTRSIEDVHPSDLHGFTQCHFFAGVGVWSYALRQAGWADDRPVWTGSCPCQPFSAAGKGAGFADERHLWPAFHHLIKECKAPTVFGEQVASKDADPWIDLVQTDLEALGYAFGAVPFPSAGVGAPHIRDRLYWVADTKRSQRRSVSLLGHSEAVQPHGTEQAGQSARDCCVGGLDDARQNHDDAQVSAARAGESQTDRPANQFGRSGVSFGGMAVANKVERRRRAEDAKGQFDWEASRRDEGDCKPAGRSDRGIQGSTDTSPTNGYWRDADWLFCRDGRWRPVEPLPQPLVDGSSESLGRVRPEVITQIEKEINAATAQTQGGRAAAMRALLEALGAEAKRCWPSGGFPGLHEAPFLLAFLRQLEEQGWRIAQGVSLPCPQATDGNLRGLRNIEAAGSAPCERSLGGQPTGEPADVVRVLSCLLARHASEAWGDAYATHAETGFPLTHNARARVKRLRAYGNAINAQAAQVFIESVMEAAR